MSIVFIMAYLIKEEIWLLKADFPDYNGEIIKGLLITIVVAPIAIKVVGQAIKGEWNVRSSKQIPPSARHCCAFINQCSKING